MLKFLTHKLRTHSLNEESIPEKVDGHDSGTESDDEIDRPDSMMASRASSVSPSESRDCSGCECASPIRDYPPSPSPSSPLRHDRDVIMRDEHIANANEDDDLHYDHHSSEEELEVINSSSQEIFSKYGCVESEQELDCETDVHRCSPTSTSPTCRGGGGTRGAVFCAAASAGRTSRRARNGPPEKRKWAQENDENASSGGAAVAAAAAAAAMAGCGAPVLRFRTSPPLEALKPRGPPPAASRSLAAAPLPATVVPPPLAPHNSPPAKVFHLAAEASSPRKRTRHIARRHIQRPCLDFDKMQQLKVRPVTAWRHGAGEHGSELSVFCW